MFSQNTFNNKHWYEQFNTKIDFGSAIGVTQQHQVLLSHVTEESNNFLNTRPQKIKRDTGICGGTLPILHFLRQSGK